MSQVPRGVAAFLYDDSMGYGQLTGNVRVGRRIFQVQNCGENCHVFGRVNPQPPRLLPGQRTRAACSNGDALSFAECWAAKQIGMCSVNLWITQCEATCGNDCEYSGPVSRASSSRLFSFSPSNRPHLTCEVRMVITAFSGCGDSNFDSCASLAGLTFADINVGCDFLQGNSICRASCLVC